MLAGGRGCAKAVISAGGLGGDLLNSQIHVVRVPYTVLPDHSSCGHRGCHRACQQRLQDHVLPGEPNLEASPWVHGVVPGVLNMTGDSALSPSCYIEGLQCLGDGICTCMIVPGQWLFDIVSALAMPACPPKF